MESGPGAHAAVCAPYQHITVHGTDWIRSPDNFGGGNACLNQPNGTVSFTVKSQTAPPPAEDRVARTAKYNTGADLWFSATPQFSAPVTEVMFWQNVQGLKPWVGTALGFELWNGGGGLKTTSGWIHQ